MGKRGLIFILSCLIFLTFLLFSIKDTAYSFSIGKIDLLDLGNGSYLISATFNSFPSQDILLALKRQKGEVLVLYEFEIKVSDPLAGERFLHREVYFQKAGYAPETNVYYLEDNFGVLQFRRAEDLLPKLAYLNSYPLRIRGLAQEKISKAQLFLRVSISFNSHLDRDLRYIKGETKRLYQTSKRYVIQ